MQVLDEFEDDHHYVPTLETESDVTPVPVTLYSSYTPFTTGRSIGNHERFILYGIKNGRLRAIHKLSAKRVLLVGHSKPAIDIQFRPSPNDPGMNGNEVASVCEGGKLVVWTIDEMKHLQPDGTMSAPILEWQQSYSFATPREEAPDPDPQSEGQPTFHFKRLLWHPTEHILWANTGTEIYEFNLSKIQMPSEEASDEAEAKKGDGTGSSLLLDGNVVGVRKVLQCDHSDMSVNADGTILAAGGEDKDQLYLYRIHPTEPYQQLGNWTPHDDRGLFHIRFLGNKRAGEGGELALNCSSMLLTTDATGCQLSLWNTKTPNNVKLVQTITIAQRHQPLPALGTGELTDRPEHDRYVLDIDPSASFVAMGNQRQPYIIILKLTYPETPDPIGNARVECISEFFVKERVVALAPITQPQDPEVDPEKRPPMLNVAARQAMCLQFLNLSAKHLSPTSDKSQSQPPPPAGGAPNAGCEPPTAPAGQAPPAAAEPAQTPAPAVEAAPAEAPQTAVPPAVAPSAPSAPAAPETQPAATPAPVAPQAAPETAVTAPAPAPVQAQAPAAAAASAPPVAAQAPTQAPAPASAAPPAQAQAQAPVPAAAAAAPPAAPSVTAQQVVHVVQAMQKSVLNMQKCMGTWMQHTAAQMGTTIQANTTQQAEKLEGHFSTLNAYKSNLDHIVKAVIESTNSQRKVYEEYNKQVQEEASGLQEVLHTERQASQQIVKDMQNARKARMQEEEERVASIIETLKTVIEKSVPELVNATVAEQVSALQTDLDGKLCAKVGATLEKEIQEVVLSHVLPAMSKAAEDMFKDLQKGLLEGLGKQQRMVAERLNPTVLHDILTEIIPRAPPSAGSPEGETEEVKQANIQTLLTDGNYEEAFRIAISTMNVETVLWVCKNAPDATTVVCAVNNSPVLLGMLKVLSKNLDIETDIKVQWLEEVIIKLSEIRDDEVVRTHSPVVFPEAYASMDEFLADKSHPVSTLRSVRMLHTALKNAHPK